MRGYECYFSYYKGKDLIKSQNTACWGGITNNRTPADEIYIYKFRYPATEMYINLAVDTVNEVTPCSLVTIDEKEYIKYKLLKRYNADLLLLNVIRNLWYSFPKYSQTFYKDLEDYNKRFFEELKKLEDEPDPILRITTANQRAIDSFPDSVAAKYTAGHSNFVRFSKQKKKIDFDKWLKDKASDEYIGMRLSNFLTTQTI